MSTTSFRRPEDVVAHFGALQAQDYPASLWAIGLRLPGAQQGDVERAIADRAIVRTWPMRGTLHFLAARDARWMTELLAPRAVAAAAGRFRALGLDEDVLSLARTTVIRELEGGQLLPRARLYDALERAGVPMEGQRGIHLLWRLAHDGLVCVGPHQAKQPSFALFEEWLPKAPRLPRDEALAELARRYFAGHGPATARDLAWWSGLTLKETRQAIALAGPHLEHESVDGESSWFVPSAAEPVAKGPRVARALPAFDEYFVGYANRSAALTRVGAGKLTPFEVLAPLIVVGGQVVAKWRRSLSKTRVTFTTTPLVRTSGTEAASIQRALADYARFVGLEVAT